MTEPGARETADADDIPQARAASARRGSQHLIWLVPLVAALIGGWLAVRAVLERGPSIEISFATAEGLEPGKTKLKYRNVDIGDLKSVSFTPDYARVIATIELSKQAEKILVDDTRFWVVRPRIAGGQISGLGTLLSGAYIGVDVGKSTKSRREFTGLEVPPIVTIDLPGRLLSLRAENLGSLDIGSPVYLRRVKVGQVVAYELAADGKSVALRVFVNAPHDRHVGNNTRFWHASGVDLAVDASGVRLETESFASLLLGGLAFETPADSSGAGAGKPRTEYRLFADRAQALQLPDVAEETYVMVFKESVRGLSPGAPVDFRGVVIGEVVSINVDADPVKPDISLPVEVKLFPGRLHGRYGQQTDADLQTYERLLERMVGRGLRAQLRTGSLITGQLYIALDFFPKAPQVRLERGQRPREIPTIVGGLTELQDVVGEIARKLERFPLDAIGADVRKALGTVDAIGADARKALATLDATLGTAADSLKAAERLVAGLDKETAPELQATLADLRRTLAGLRGTLGTAERALAADAPLQLDLRDALREVSRAAEAMRGLADYLERNPEALIRGRKEDRP